jgi:hypothetical protein
MDGTSILSLLKSNKNNLYYESMERYYLINFALVKSVIAYGIIEWGVNTSMSCLQISQNKLIKFAIKKGLRCLTINLYNDFKVLNIKKIYLKPLSIISKKKK